ncbi:DUF1329 domain-containing protein [Janthinobacterium tructae]|uniref:DUF1329 domain-containing protein n=1 Tax=Janthinobacterium tructae TaxID=2590869 RepID=UPI00249A0335|nr:DUF1329 domain-containing protein [Janthinobacterium tructae]MDI3292325.1 DUF1329 domain-containing protein [Janthinobacterium tructae]
MFKQSFMAVNVVLATVLFQTAFASVSAEEAAALKSNLTPLGAEKAGNKDGTIPAWDGAYVKSIPGTANGKYPDPFSAEKPIAQITAKNAAEYSSKLSEGTLALLKKYPTYRIDVYPSHRTAGAPQWVYDNTFKAATNAKLTNNGGSFEGAWGGVPFPIPKNGNEVMWNHLVHPHPASYDLNYINLVGSSDGKISMASKGEVNELSAYYQKDGSAEKFNKNFSFTRFNTTAPAFKAGEAVVTHESLDVSKEPQAWQYLVGQRRVRRTPTIGYDTPDFVASGANYFDEVYGFLGRLDRYNWKLIGKQEMLIPYNNNKFVAAGIERAFVPSHTNPDTVRWEMHRVWVVEAVLATGKRHVVPKRRYYIDEDSWAVMMMDGFDSSGKLWRTSQVMNVIVPDAGMHATNTSVVYNLDAGTMSVIQYLDAFKVVAPRSVNFWSAEALSTDSSR